MSTLDLEALAEEANTPLRSFPRSTVLALIERVRNTEAIARLAEESEAGWRREADELAERVAEAWDEGWLAGNRWAFSDADADAIDTNPYREAAKGSQDAQGAAWGDGGGEVAPEVGGEADGAQIGDSIRRGLAQIHRAAPSDDLLDRIERLEGRDERQREENLRILKHEAATDPRAHDGECCIRARLGSTEASP